VLRRIPSLARSSGATAATFDRYVGEPVGRDTLPAIALSCALAVHEDPEAIVGVFTSDHVIRPRLDLARLIERAFALIEAEPELLVTYGVRPDQASTAYGYLELGDALFESGLSSGTSPARGVLRFREKPDAVTAASFLAAGPSRYLWNSGMFAWRADRFLELVGRYEPGLRAAVDLMAAAAGSPRFDEVLASGYSSLKKLSVDYGVMEPASKDPEVRIAALPLEIEWRDIGSWPSYGELLSADASGNAASGAAIFSESSGNLAVSTEKGHLIACLGCEDLIIISTDGATLVCPRSRADELKKLYALVAEKDGGRYR
jgi:mannose-1-phosphate guanylyltransferase